ncbi:hypothetical protein M413DRAFT_203694 [Hebeloma cylindrosporum]|uniref:BHLH domain-containing protein n=1 Tax=Hebeloma cylindrosporum TaxID=76867 RepID=A0A0C3CTZ8_HEBCY|nr:hypothetical protein M413DRAFT_203694 [Hebeloma cylindrosporum h7]
MSTSQMLSMDFDNKSAFVESSFDSSFNYMDSGLDYFQYPPASPSLGASVGLPQTASSMEFNSLNEYTYNPAFDSSSPPRSYSPMESAGVAPQALTYSLTPGELSDAMISGRASRGSGSRSPPAVPYAATVPRSHRYNPIAVPPNRASARAAHKRRSSRSNDDSDDEDDEEFKPGSIAGNDDSAPRDSRRETVRKQRIESEQRRRDELREGYSRLKESLPSSNQKASKVSLLERATGHIKYLEAIKGQLEARLKGADHEVHRLRTVNEALMLNRAGAAPLAPPTAFNN